MSNNDVIVFDYYGMFCKMLRGARVPYVAYEEGMTRVVSLQRNSECAVSVKFYFNQDGKFVDIKNGETS